MPVVVNVSSPWTAMRETPIALRLQLTVVQCTLRRRMRWWECGTPLQVSISLKFRGGVEM